MGDQDFPVGGRMKRERNERGIFTTYSYSIRTLLILTNVGFCNTLMHILTSSTLYK